jgi:CxxC motif-containing protein (DUF1111 family)
MDFRTGGQAMKIRSKAAGILVGILGAGLVLTACRKSNEPESRAASGVADPGVRRGAPGAGGPLKNLTSDESAFFQDGANRFAEVEVVAGGANNGLGPRFNSNQCLSCHSEPASGGTSPAQNPLIAIATLSVERFNGLSAQEQQDVINFLRSL